MESTTPNSTEALEQQVVEVASYLNKKLYGQIKRANQEFQNYDSPEQSLTQFLNISDPLVMKLLKNSDSDG